MALLGLLWDCLKSRTYSDSSHTFWCKISYVSQQDEHGFNFCSVHPVKVPVCKIQYCFVILQSVCETQISHTHASATLSLHFVLIRSQSYVVKIRSKVFLKISVQVFISQHWIFSYYQKWKWLLFLPICFFLSYVILTYCDTFITMYSNTHSNCV